MAERRCNAVPGMMNGMMNTVLSSIFFFIVALGILITIHEFGHYWVARKMGVKVLRFSIGFGKPLWTHHGKVDNTEYVIAAIPLGGYVKMLDEREAAVAPHELHRAFNRQPLWSRFAIVFAGPLFNFLLAIIVYWAIFIIGISGLKPVVGMLTPNSIAQRGGFQVGDVIVEVNGNTTPTWEVVVLAMLDKALEQEAVTVKVRDADQRAVMRNLNFTTITGSDLDQGNLLESIGITPSRPALPAVVGQLERGGPAEQAGLQVGDKIIAVDGQPIPDWDTWVAYVRPRANQVIHVAIERMHGQSVIGESREHQTFNVRPVPVVTKDGTIGRIGVGVKVPDELPAELQSILRYSPGEAIIPAVIKTWDMSILTLRMLSKMITGMLSATNLSGPISIAQYAGSSANAGLVAFLGFLAIVSVSLGVLNLLPIPLLDGGHLMYYLIEAVKGSPVSDDVQILGQRVGIALLGTLMIFAFYNDLTRLFGPQ